MLPFFGQEKEVSKEEEEEDPWVLNGWSDPPPPPMLDELHTRLISVWKVSLEKNRLFKSKYQLPILKGAAYYPKQKSPNATSSLLDNDQPCHSSFLIRNFTASHPLWQ